MDSNPFDAPIDHEEQPSQPNERTLGSTIARGARYGALIGFVASSVSLLGIFAFDAITTGLRDQLDFFLLLFIGGYITCMSTLFGVLTALVVYAGRVFLTKRFKELMWPVLCCAIFGLAAGLLSLPPIVVYGGIGLIAGLFVLRMNRR